MNRILLVEDDADLSRNIRDALEKEQYEVLPVYDGLLAFKMLKRDSYDCIIMDINLPGWNGYKLCSEFRQFNEHTPVIMLTAFDQLEDKVMGYEKGADDYLTKPFYMQELLLKIQVLIKRSSQNTDNTSSPKTLQSGDLQINLKNKTVQIKGNPINLTPREYQILVKLMQANGQVVSKQDLVQEIWGKSFDLSSSTNTIEVYINFLRKKLDKPYGKSSIKTKVGYGYYLEQS